jgi:DNA-binding NarL/FixJ family response regulator
VGSEEPEASIIRCLVADDHPAVRAGLVAVLGAEEDIEVVGDAGDGEEAVALTERRRPQVAVVDMRMPRMDGVEYCQAVAGEDGPAIVLYTGYSDGELLETALNAGARGFVLKTGPMSDVVRAVRAVASGSPYVDPGLTSMLLERRAHSEESALSRRETEVLQLLANGLTTDGAAGELFLSPTTVRSYAESGMEKLEASNRTHAVAEAIRRRLIA